MTDPRFIRRCIILLLSFGLGTFVGWLLMALQ